jgi:methionyl-tRNA synthetase
MSEQNIKHFYITTTLPYVNSKPHLGFAMELVRADVIARYKELMGYEVFFNTGTDEHGMKLFQRAQEQGIEVQELVDKHAADFRNLLGQLAISEDVHFIRTTDKKHIAAAQNFWNKVFDNGYIYKKNYTAKYCVGCELEKTDSDLENGRCPIHPDRDIELIDEENYFFKFSEFTQPLLDYYAQHSGFVVPDFRFNEIKAFVERGLKDFSISRLKEKMPWGVPVPGDTDHVMYVWFDALVNYISTLDWPGDLFESFWEEGYTVQICGKDNLRQQTAMWQAMLMAAGISPTNNVIINGFLNGADGRKMSKSLGNVVDPEEILNLVGVDALRFYVVHGLQPFDDSPTSMEHIQEQYNAHLVNGLGNLTNRIVKMASSYEVEVELPNAEDVWLDKENVDARYHDAFKNLNPGEALRYLMEEVREMDVFIAQEEPFKKIKTDELAAKEDVARLMLNLWYVAVLVEPFMPDTSMAIQQAVTTKQVPENPLFPRLV